MRFFSYDSKFSQVLLRLSMSCWLNVLWIICSLPIVTIGAATAALYSVTLKIADERESEITKSFFKGFKDNFAQATRIWLILLAAGIILGYDAYIASHLRTATTGFPAVMWTLNLALLVVIGIIFVIILLYIFPLIASVKNTDRNMFKNSFLIGIRYLFCTIMLFAIHFAMFFAVVAIFTPLIIFGEGLCALLSSYLLIRIIHLVSYREEESAE